MVTTVSLVPSPESQAALNDYVQTAIGLTPTNSFHSTIFYAEECPLFKNTNTRRKIQRRLPITLDPSLYSLEIFGQNRLVLRYEDAVVSEINRILLGEEVRQSILDWPNVRGERRRILEKSCQRRESPIYWDYNPHITLVKDFPLSSSSGVAPINFPITLDSFVWSTK